MEVSYTEEKIQELVEEILEECYDREEQEYAMFDYLQFELDIPFTLLKWLSMEFTISNESIRILLKWLSMEFTISNESIRNLCNSKTYQKGLDYYSEGRVNNVTIKGKRIYASVRGTYNYNVKKTMKKDYIFDSCSCPYDWDGSCKHVIATLLHVQNNEEEITRKIANNKEKVHKILEQTSDEELRTFIIRQLEKNYKLQKKLIQFFESKNLVDYQKKKFSQRVIRENLI